jgi:hypothetical protein
MADDGDRLLIRHNDTPGARPARRNIPPITEPSNNFRSARANAAVPCKAMSDNLREHTISPAIWFGGGGLFGAIGLSAWGAYQFSFALPPAAVIALSALTGMTIVCLLAAGREYYIREGIRIHAEHIAAISGAGTPTERTSAGTPPGESAGRGISAVERLRISQEREAEAQAEIMLTMRRVAGVDAMWGITTPPAGQSTAPEPLPYVLVSLVYHELVSSSDPDEIPYDHEYLRFHNIGPEAAIGVGIDELPLSRFIKIQDRIEVLERDAQEDAFLQGGLGQAIDKLRRAADIPWSEEVHIPITVLFHDRHGRDSSVRHAVIQKGTDLRIEDVDHKHFPDEYWTKVPNGFRI